MEKGSSFILGLITGVACFVGGILFYIYIIKPRTEQYILETNGKKEISSETLLLNKINNNIEQQIPEGRLYDYRINVTDKIKMLYDDRNKGLNWIAFTICNEGPSPVYFAVNEWERPEIPLEVGKCTSVSFNRRGSIKRIYLVCDSGQSSTVTIRGLK